MVLSILDLAKAMMARFRGYEDAHGRYTFSNDTKPNAKGKRESAENLRVTWKKLPGSKVVPELWVQHLDPDATYILGIIPTNREGISYFGAIDIDVYPIEPAVLGALIASLKLPLIIVRTKSGGAHLYLFIKGDEGAPSSLVMAKLKEFAVALGYPNSEIFPKQPEVNDTDGSAGNWINMPYFTGELSTRHATDNDGRGLTIEEFLAYAETIAVTPEQLAKIKVEKPKKKEATLGDDDDTEKEKKRRDPFRDGPPCLQKLARDKVPEGMRNEALFSFMVFIHKKWPDTWAEKTRQVAQMVMHPPMPIPEVEHSIGAFSRSLGKEYGYKCKTEPLVSICDKATCLRRKYGVGGGIEDIGVVIGGMTIYQGDPATHYIDIEGKLVIFTSQQLMNQQQFKLRVFDQVHKLTTFLKQDAWEALLTEWTDKAMKVKPPSNATMQGSLLEYLEKFCTDVPANAMAELIDGRTWHDPDGRTYFIGLSFMEFLKRASHLRIHDASEVYRLLKEVIPSISDHIKVIKGVRRNVWSVPTFPEQDEAFDVPRDPPKDAM